MITESTVAKAYLEVDMQDGGGKEEPTDSFS